MAETVHLSLKANGEEIQGSSTQLSLGRENTIECVTFEHKILTAREAGITSGTGRRRYELICIQKRIDKSSPLLAKALCENQIIEAEFKFFRPNPKGDGTTEQFYTICIPEGRVASFRQYVPSTIGSDTQNLPPMEEVGFTLSKINWTITDGGISHEDSWGESK